MSCPFQASSGTSSPMISLKRSSLLAGVVGSYSVSAFSGTSSANRTLGVGGLCECASSASESVKVNTPERWDASGPNAASKALGLTFQVGLVE